VNIRQIPFLLIGLALLVLAGLMAFRADQVEAPTTPESGTGVKPGSNDFAYENASGDNITVELPFPGAVVGKKFSVIGEARGTWYFEASFPVVLLDRYGKILTQTPAQAQGEWMTNDFVPFKADLSSPGSYEGPATLVLKKDNPSGLPQNDASISFPITIEY